MTNKSKAKRWVELSPHQIILLIEGLQAVNDSAAGIEWLRTLLNTSAQIKVR